MNLVIFEIFFGVFRVSKMVNFLFNCKRESLLLLGKFNKCLRIILIFYEKLYLGWGGFFINIFLNNCFIIGICFIEILFICGNIEDIVDLWILIVWYL